MQTLLEQRIAELEEEVSLLRRRLALEADEDAVFRIAARWSLTGTEAALVAILYHAAPRALSKGAICDVLPSRKGREDDEVADVFVCKIRKKVGKGCIETVRGFGFRISAEFREAIRPLVSMSHAA